MQALTDIKSPIVGYAHIKIFQAFQVSGDDKAALELGWSKPEWQQRGRIELELGMYPAQVRITRIIDLSFITNYI